MKTVPALSTVLLIGGMTDGIGAIAAGFEHNGIRTVFVECGKTGIGQARAMQPDLILLDTEMADQDGFEVCRRLKEIEQTCAIPVIFMLASHEACRAAEVFAAGGADYLMKPLRLDEVMARTGVHLSLRALERNAIVNARNTDSHGESLTEPPAKPGEKFVEVEQRLRETLDNISDLLYLLEITNEGRFRFAEINLAVERLLQMPRSSIIGKYVEEVIPDACKQGVLDRLRRCADTGKVIDEEIELSLSSGLHYFQATIFPVHERATGNIYRVVSLARDITIRKQHEAICKRNDDLESLVTKIIAAAPGALAVYRKDKDGRVSMPYASPQLEEITGYDREAMRQDALSAFQRIHPDDLAWHIASIEESARTLTPWQNEFRIRHPQKGEIWLERHFIPERASDGSILWYGFLHDVTLRKQHEAMRSERDHLESLVRQIVEVAPGVLFMYRLDTNGKRSMPYTSPTLEEITGLDREKMRHDASADFRCIHPEDAAHHIASIERSAQTLTPWHNEFRMLHPGKGEVWIEGRGIPQRMDDGATVWYGFLHDVTVRKRAEESLLASEQKFKTLADNVPDVIVRYDRECRRIYANRTFMRTIGIPFDHLIGAHPGQNWRGDIPLEEYVALLRQVIATGVRVERLMSWTYADGKVVHAIFNIVPEYDVNGDVAGALTIGCDITELREAEMRLAESRERLRELAAHRDNAREEERKHIARELHDELGQFLSALRMQTSVLRLKFGKGNPALTEHVNTMIEMVDRNIQMVRNIASSLRPAVLDLGIVAALEWLVNDFINYARVRCKLTVAKEKFDMGNHCATTLFRIAQESLTNVARHADARQVTISLARTRAHFHLRLCDDGKGFHPDKLSKKSFGLIGMRERVLMLGGEIRIISAPGKGTVVEVDIPADDLSVNH